MNADGSMADATPGLPRFPLAGEPGVAAFDLAPLADVTVVSVEQAVSAPLATRHLADLGARVIKIERPDGGDFARFYDATVHGLSAYFVWANRSKESVTLDITSAPGRDLLERLIAEADVFVVNLAPASARRLGLDAPSVSSRHGAVVACEISGFGAGGPMSDCKAYDLLIQAEAGLLEVTGTAQDRAKAGISVADIAAGMYAYSSIIAALLRRTRTGRGCSLEVAMIDALAEWMSMPLYYSHYGGTAPVRSGSNHATIAPYGPFTAADGDVLLAVQHEREWARLCADVLEVPDLATDERFSSNSRRVAASESLKDAIEAALSTMKVEEVTDRLAAAGIASARINDLADLWNHRQLRERARFANVETPMGELEILRPPAEQPGGAFLGAVPSLGAHTDAVLAGLGLSTQERVQLREAGVV